MIAFIAIAIVAISALVNGFSPDVEHLKNDYQIITGKQNGHRLAGWQTLRPNNVKCDMVRRDIKTFGYCWQDENEQRNINTTTERGWVHEALQQWEKCGGIKIVEEPTCRKGPDFVTVNVGSYGPVTYPEMGDPDSCRIDGFSMTLNFYTFGPNIESYAKTEKIRKSNIQMYALHEFGHFLGFDHEQNRADRQYCIYQVDATEVGPNAIWSNYFLSNEYDTDSIMNYCRPNVHYKPWLSLIDKQAVWSTYGGGNWDECLAVTTTWEWTSADELDETTLAELQRERETGVIPDACSDIMAQKDCEDRVGTCDGDWVKYWCPKTCKLC